MPVGVFITANHKGYFLFDLCNLDASSESEQCFALHKLKLANGQDRYTVPDSKSDVYYNTTVVLPSNLNCKHCVFRWTYVTGELTIFGFRFRLICLLFRICCICLLCVCTGNSWGICQNGSGAVGCGEQEHFRGCSDIHVLGDRKSRR